MDPSWVLLFMFLFVLLFLFVASKIFKWDLGNTTLGVMDRSWVLFFIFLFFILFLFVAFPFYSPPLSAADPQNSVDSWSSTSLFHFAVNLSFKNNEQKHDSMHR